MNQIHKQRGLSLPMVIVLVGFIGLAGSLGLATLPVYLSDRSVQDVLIKTEQKVTTEKLSRRDLKTYIGKVLNVNSVDNLKAKDFDIKNEDGMLRVSVEYEVRKPLFYNIDVVMKFGPHGFEAKQR